jgi:hypothetical protein
MLSVNVALIWIEETYEGSSDYITRVLFQCFCTRRAGGLIASGSSVVGGHLVRCSFFFTFGDMVSVSFAEEVSVSSS